MKDERDHATRDLLEFSRKPPKSFNETACKRPESVRQDAASAAAPVPECAVIRPTLLGGVFSARYVPVSFVAKDWKVTPRRIRALLAAGRLDGRLMVNGFWEVRFPYLFAFGTRGPALKRTRPPEPNLKLVKNEERSKV